MIKRVILRARRAILRKFYADWDFEKNVAVDGSPAQKSPPDHTLFRAPNPNAFPRYIVSYYGGVNVLVSKALFDAYDGVSNAHRYIQHVPFEGCNKNLLLEGKALPDMETSRIERYFKREASKVARTARPPASSDARHREKATSPE